MWRHNDHDLDFIFDCASFRNAFICLAIFLTKEIESSCVFLFVAPTTHSKTNVLEMCKTMLVSQHKYVFGVLQQMETSITIMK